MNSMTGFGKGEASGGGCRAQVDVKAVNHRYLDVVMRGQPALAQYENEIRRILSEELSRGHIEVYLSLETETDGVSAKLNAPLAAAAVQAAQTAAELYGVPAELTAAQLLSLPDMLVVEEAAHDEDQVRALIRQAAREAVGKLKAVRAQEGRKLAEDMLQRIDALEAYIDVVEDRKDAVIADYRERLNTRVRILLGGAVPDRVRLAQEVAIYADRSDVTEETVRLRSHLDQFRQIAAQPGAVGKHLDFVVQELHREFNTISSKSQDSEITDAVLAAKAEVEKIREQVQNVE